MDSKADPPNMPMMSMSIAEGTPLHFLTKRFQAASSRSGLNRCASRPQCDFNRVRNSGSLSARAIKRANPRVSPVEKYPA